MIWEEAESPSGFRFQWVFLGAELPQKGLAYVKIYLVENVISWKYM